MGGVARFERKCTPSKGVSFSLTACSQRNKKNFSVAEFSRPLYAFLAEIALFDPENAGRFQKNFKMCKKLPKILAPRRICHSERSEESRRPVVSLSNSVEGPPAVIKVA